MKKVAHAVAKREIAALLIDVLGDIPQGERFDQIDFAETVELVVMGAIMTLEYGLLNLTVAKTLTKRERERIITQIWPIAKLIGE